MMNVDQTISDLTTLPVGDRLRVVHAIWAKRCQPPIRVLQCAIHSASRVHLTSIDWPDSSLPSEWKNACLPFLRAIT